jgi:CHAT domain
MPRKIGVSSTSEALKALEQKLKGLSALIANNLISRQVQTLLVNRSAETVVHWVIKDPELDAVPWELAFQKFDSSPTSEPPLLVRFPVWAKGKDDEPTESVAAPASDEAPRKIAYVLGTEVVKGPLGTEWCHKLLSVLRRAAPTKFAVQQNFSPTGLQPVSIVTLPQLIGDARIIHLLCHGVVDTGADMYLQLQKNALGQVRPADIYAWRLSARPLVFVNACSSSAASLSATGFTTFGKSFLEVGAAVYIGALAPVVTEAALSFATEFFDACLGEGLSVAGAMSKVRKTMATSPDPSWRLYSIYGDLQVIESLTN